MKIINPNLKGNWYVRIEGHDIVSYYFRLNFRQIILDWERQASRDVIKYLCSVSIKDYFPNLSTQGMMEIPAHVYDKLLYGPDVLK